LSIGYWIFSEGEDIQPAYADPIRRPAIRFNICQENRLPKSLISVSLDSHSWLLVIEYWLLDIFRTPTIAKFQITYAWRHTQSLQETFGILSGKLMD
jgi:hypothetical protein